MKELNKHLKQPVSKKEFNQVTPVKVGLTNIWGTWVKYLFSQFKFKKLANLLYEGNEWNFCWTVHNTIYAKGRNIGRNNYSNKIYKTLTEVPYALLLLMKVRWMDESVNHLKFNNFISFFGLFRNFRKNWFDNCSILKVFLKTSYRFLQSVKHS